MLQTRLGSPKARKSKKVQSTELLVPKNWVTKGVVKVKYTAEATAFLFKPFRTNGQKEKKRKKEKKKREENL